MFGGPQPEHPVGQIIHHELLRNVLGFVIRDEPIILDAETIASLHEYDVSQRLLDFGRVELRRVRPE